MLRVTVVDANLPKIIQNVQKGNECFLTDNNEEVAVLLSIEDYRKMKNKRAFEKLEILKAIAPIGTVSEILKMHDEGRK